MQKTPLADRALYTLKDAIAVLGATTPPPPEPMKRSIAESNALIVELENRLNVKHALPIFNLKRAAQRIEHLEGLLRATRDGSLDSAVAAAAAHATSAPAAAAALAAAPPIVPRAAPATPAAASRPFVSTGDATTDAAMRSHGVHNLRALKAKLACDQLEADAARYPAGSLSRKAIESNLSKARAQFNESNK